MPGSLSLMSRLIPGLRAIETPRRRKALISLSSGTTVAIGPPDSLEPCLTAEPPQGPITKRLQLLTADHALIVCCLADWRDLSVAEIHLRPLREVLAPWLRELETLPLGALSAVTFALRLRDQPRLLVRVEAADASLAVETHEWFVSYIKRLQVEFSTLREDLKRALPADDAAEIDQFLAAASEGATVEKNGQEIDISLPLGQDAAALRRFAKFVLRHGG